MSISIVVQLGVPRGQAVGHVLLGQLHGQVELGVGGPLEVVALLGQVFASGHRVLSQGGETGAESGEEEGLEVEVRGGGLHEIVEFVEARAVVVV